MSIRNYQEFLRTDDNSQPRALKKVAQRGLVNMRRGIREASRQQAEIDTTDTSAEKGQFLEFIDMLKDILGYIEMIIPGEGRRDDSTIASENMPLFDDSVIGNAYRTVSDDEDEEDDEEDEAEDDGDSSKGSNRQRRGRPNRRNASSLLRKINSLANRARTFFRMNIKPIYSRLSATDEETLRTVLEDILSTTTTVPESSLNKIYTSLNNLYEEIRRNDGREVPEIVGGNRRKANKRQDSHHYRTVPSPFSPEFAHIDKKYML